MVRNLIGHIATPSRILGRRVSAIPRLTFQFLTVGVFHSSSLGHVIESFVNADLKALGSLGSRSASRPTTREHAGAYFEVCSVTFIFRDSKPASIACCVVFWFLVDFSRRCLCDLDLCFACSSDISMILSRG